jgi:hypothetical protein
MRLCQKCNSCIPSRALVNGVVKGLNTRKFCLSCSPFGGRNNRNLCIPKDKNGLPEKKTCAMCGFVKPSSNFYKRRNRSTLLSYCKSCVAAQSKSRSVKLKADCVKHKGGKCSLCGYSKCLAALEFHHIDRSKKQFGVGGKRSTTFENLKEELEKCVLLCANCHREVEYGTSAIPDSV